jgi:hypothetical protein
MCVDAAPIRNTLYGFIVSPGYPHPMADNIKCSINIGMISFSFCLIKYNIDIYIYISSQPLEADSSMFIELAPIQIHLQEAIKCRSEYLEIFGYLNPTSNNASYDDSASNRNSKTVWRSYHTWCGAERSANSPSPNSRYLISSNSLYMSLQTAVSKKPRFFKIRYKGI